MRYLLYFVVLGAFVIGSQIRPDMQVLALGAVVLGHIPALLKISAQRRIFGSMSILHGFDELPALVFMSVGWIVCIGKTGPGSIPLAALSIAAVVACYFAVRWNGRFTTIPAVISSFEAPVGRDALAIRGQQFGFALRCCVVLVSAMVASTAVVARAFWAETALAALSIAATMAIAAWIVTLARMRSRLQPLLKSAQLDAVRADLKRLKPEIVVYFSSPKMKNSKAIEAVVKQTAAAGRPFFLLVRERRVFTALCKAGVRHVVLAERIEALDHFVINSLKLAIYINDAEKNGHFIRFNQLHHINILPAASASWGKLPPNYDMYDTLLTRSVATRDMLANAATPEMAAKLTFLATAKTDKSIPILPAFPLAAVDGTVSIGWAMDAPSYDDHRDWLMIERAAEHVFSSVVESSKPPLRLFVTPAKKQRGDRNYQSVIERLRDHAEALNHASSFLDPANRTPRVQFLNASVENGYNRADVAMCCDLLHLDKLRASGKPIIFFDAMGQAADIPDDLYVLRSDLSNLASVLADAIGPDSKAPLRQARVRLGQTAVTENQDSGASCLAEVLLARLEPPSSPVSEPEQAAEIAA